jgi:hypothetical protein
MFGYSSPIVNLKASAHVELPTNQQDTDTVSELKFLKKVEELHGASSPTVHLGARSPFSWFGLCKGC